MLSLEGWWLGIVSFLGALMPHIVVWRRSVPPPGALDLVLYLFLLPYSLALLAIGFGGHYPFVAALTHAILASNYLAIYPAFQASSPTVHLLTMLHDAPRGMTREEVVQHLVGITAVESRLEDLKRAGLVFRSGNSFTLSRSGARLAAVFIHYRGWLGLGQGAG